MASDVSTTSRIVEVNDVNYLSTGTNRIVNGLSIEEFVKNKNAYFEMACDEDFSEMAKAEEDAELQKMMMESHIEWTDPASTINTNVGDETLTEHLESYDVVESRMTDVLYDIDGSLLTPGGIKKRMVKRGVGENAKVGDLVYVHYQLFFEHYDEAFDDTRAKGRQGQPTRFTIGRGEVIRGLDVAVIGMNRGQRDHALVTHEYAFGKWGCEPRIPKEARVLMYIQIVRILQCGSELPVDELSPKERLEKGFDAILKAAEKMKTIGNDHFKSNEMSQAIQKYMRAQDFANELVPVSERETFNKDMLVYAIQLNLANAYLKMDKFRKVIAHCNEALAVRLPDARKTKAYYRLAKALYESGKIEEAEKPIKRALALHCGDASIKRLNQLITDDIKKRRQQERDTAQKMFQNI